MNNSRMTRKFERLLFQGIPEQPEPVWERNDNTNVSMRKSGHSQTFAGESLTEDYISVGRFKYNFENGTVEYIPTFENLENL